jgi:5-methylcytosine-specific restriction endonuclease McrA
VDHIVPIDDNGTNDDDNLQTLCHNCNAGKKAFYNPSKATRNLLAEIRTRPRAQQLEVYAFLKLKFAARDAVSEQQKLPL